jgi:hypothetical protein
MKLVLSTKMPQLDWMTARAERAWHLRQDGLTYTEIVKALGQLGDPTIPITRGAARLLVLRWEARLNRPADIPVTMTERACNVLKAAAEKADKPLSKQLARKFIETGEILRADNCGAMTLAEITDWAYS